MLEFEDPVPLKDGSTASGMLLRLSNFFGDLTIDNNIRNKSIRCHAENQDQWTREILSILSSE